MFSATFSIRLIARIALFAMLCQALLPTAVYTSSSNDPAMLSQMARAFGVPDNRALSAAHAHHHHADAEQVTPGDSSTTQMPTSAPAHDHGVHCSLCLAHASDLTLVVLFMPAALKLPFDHAYVAIFDADFMPRPLRSIMPRGPPQYVSASAI